MWFEKSAEGECEQGQCNLSKLYASGVGVQKDEKKAFYWAKKSAEQNDSESQYLVG